MELFSFRNWKLIKSVTVSVRKNERNDFPSKCFTSSPYQSGMTVAATGMTDNHFRGVQRGRLGYLAFQHTE
jgi:hypothetical protein